ncbi:MAG TPA: hypothetical protein VKA83_07815 [Methylomirabilota bacterium]|nr:hypothetical protein [Methylomirabilota bacterium]
MAAAYEVLNVSEDQVQDDSGNLVDVFDITFSITGHSGTFTAQVPQTGDPVAEAFAQITAKLGTVNAIYAGASSEPSS